MCRNIIPFEPRYAAYFKDLNLVGKERYFEVAQETIGVLGNFEQVIIESGGFIYFAEYKDAIVGYFALIKINEKSLELGKTAADSIFHGLKIGQKLLSFAIDFAKSKTWDTLVHYSSTKLGTALHMYWKYGFKEVALDNETTYLRSDIKTQLPLGKGVRDSRLNSINQRI